jgi:hypothetical protein
MEIKKAIKLLDFKITKGMIHVHDEEDPYWVLSQSGASLHKTHHIMVRFMIYIYIFQ